MCRAFGEPLSIEELVAGEPEIGEVRVAIRACAVCHSDIHAAEGSWGGILPAVYGHEAAGVVETIGPGVTRVTPGDHVVVTLLRSCGHCFFCTRGESYLCESGVRARHAGPARVTAPGAPCTPGSARARSRRSAVVHESQLAVVPASLAFDVASLLACGVITGLGAVVSTAAVPVGSSVVVIGTGGVGLNAVQGALISGARPIMALDLSTVEAGGRAGLRCDPCGGSVGRRRRRRGAKSLTGGRGADYVFVTVGSIAAIEQGLTLLRSGGTLVIVGMPAAGCDLQDRRGRSRG